MSGCVTLSSAGLDGYTYLSESVRQVVLVVTNHGVHAVHEQTHLSPLPSSETDRYTS